jgi:hypothetical protein
VLGGLAVLLVAGTLAVLFGLDPWLRRKLEKTVAEQTHGQYQLHIKSLETKLGPRALHLRGVALRPTTATVADTLPYLALHLGRLDLSGVGLLALLSGQTVPLDSLVLDSLQVRVRALAKKQAPHPTPPLYQQRPLRLGYLALHHTGGSFGPATAPTAQLTSADVRARDVLFTPAGAADTARLGFAAAWQAVLRYPQGRLGGHIIALATAAFSSDKKTFSIDSLSIEPPMPGQGTPGATQVAFLLPKLCVRGLQAAAWQHQQRFRADSVLVLQPRLSFQPPAQAPPPLWQLMRPLAQRADIMHFLINDAFMAITGVKTRPAVRHIFATGQSLRVDSVGGHAGQKRVLYARSWVARSGRLSATFDAPAYPATIERGALDTRAGTMRLHELVVWPSLSPAQLNSRKGYQVTQVRVRMPELRAQGFDFYLLSDNSHVRIARVVAEKPWLSLGSDGRAPIDPHPSILTPEAVRKLRAHLDVARFDIRSGTIYTTFRSRQTPEVGKFTISELNATLHNLSNDPHRQTLANPLTASATALVEGRSRLQAHLTAPLLDAQGRHHLWGSFGAAPLAILNRITVPTKALGFKSGAIQSIAFDMRTDRRQTSGTMQARYTDLKFELFKYKDEDFKKPLFTRLKNGVVNLVIRDNNPRPSGRFVPGDMTSRRDLKSSVFTAWRQGLMTGLLNSAGVPQKMAQKLSQSKHTTPVE